MTTGAQRIEDALARLAALPEAERKRIEAEIMAQTKNLRWVPNPGKQTLAYNSMADQLLYGGQAGGGKTDLVLGLATQEHKRSLLLRRLNKEVHWLVDRTADIIGTRDGYNGQDKRWNTPDGRLLIFGGCQYPGDEASYKGEPKDLIGIDEASEFLESQVQFVSMWLRSNDPNQRCRLVLATNPPTSIDGEWVIRWFAPWIDPEHPLYPFPDGELLWFVSLPGNKYEFYKTEAEAYAKLETLPNSPRKIDGTLHRPLTRTFIRSGLKDNPDYARTDYAARLATAPEELRRRYERGDFSIGATDDQYQIIPTSWVRAAQDRWVDRPPKDIDMTSMGVDVAQGGDDRTVLAPRWGHYFGHPIVKAGVDTKDGPAVAALIFQHMRDNCQINIDLGGGWGGSAYDHLKNMDVSVMGFIPQQATLGRSQAGNLGFVNRRTEMWWMFREALDPSNPVQIILPPDQELRVELCSTRWFEKARDMIQAEPKDDVKRRLGRSPDKAEAVLLAWYTGETRMRARPDEVSKLPQYANMGHSKFKAHYGRVGLPKPQRGKQDRW